MSSWQLLKTPKLPGSANMELDIRLFHDHESGLIPSTLRIYSWQPKCITYGYAQKVEKLIDLEKFKSEGWDIVRRPTGGGIVFHNEGEVAYSLVTDLDNPLLPEGLIPSYKRISEAIVVGLKEIGIAAEIQNPKSKIQNKSQLSNPNKHLCFSYPAEYEIVAKGKKIVGSAPKRGTKTLLQQGAILVRPADFEEISKALIFGFEEVLKISTPH